MTTAGSGVKGFGGFLGYAEDMSPLGNATALECADYLLLYSLILLKVTMQNLFHDGGFSSSGVTQKVISKYDAEN
jgi:enoyl-[acyl-carrier protein] reductase I